MNEDFLNSRVVCGISERNQVRVMAVHATIRDQPEKMKSMAPRRRERFLGHGIVCELTLRNCLIDASQVLINNSTGAQIEMAYFRVAHLSFRQTDIGTARA